MEQFRLYEIVNWTSKAEGEAPVKRTGVVVGVVPPSKDPLEFIPKGFSVKQIDNQHKKDHESYVVQAGARIFWPPVGKMRRGRAEED